MSIELTVIVEKNKLPSSEKWSQAMENEGFDLKIVEELDLCEHNGWVPCRYKGEDSGFEYWPEEDELSDWIGYEDLTEDELKIIGPRNHVIGFESDGEGYNVASLLIASAVLCTLTDGLVYVESMLAGPDAQTLVTGAEAIADVKRDLPAIESGD